ncbi:hypothetical protein HD806DRAFT_490746 [Xylariaceae sp. AK1471]|nr:hypothetical protein HD806DRAFT_490746 [Xylariaceae sp. AK1471]
MASNESKVTKSNTEAQSRVNEREEDMFVLLDRSDLLQDGELVSSYDNPPTQGGQATEEGHAGAHVNNNKGTMTEDTDVWETATVFGGKPGQK